jgi:hypothetical protein
MTKDAGCDDAGCAGMTSTLRIVDDEMKRAPRFRHQRSVSSRRASAKVIGPQARSSKMPGFP